MWHTSLNTSQPQILSSVLKNFNVYDILEPEKVNIGENANVSTGTLIDLCDGTPNIENSLDLSPDLHGSLLDKVKKSEFDLLDVYQNIYVTPAEITKKGDANNKNSNSCKVEDNKVDFTELFEKAEQGMKLSEWTKYDKNVNKEPQERERDQSNTRMYDEILDNAISSRCSKLKIDPTPELKFIETGPICEDEIDYLQPKRVLDPPVLEEITPIPSIKPVLRRNARHVSSLNVIKQSSLTPIRYEALKKSNDFQPLNLSEISLRQLQVQRSQHHDQNQQVSYTTKENLLYENKTQFSSKIEPQSDVAQLYHNVKIKTSLTDFNRPPIYRLTCQKESVPILHTVKMDPKAYRKRRIVKNDFEKVGFTKGPDIYEKSVVLPQIMKRLAKRKQVIAEQQNIQCRLMLETGENLKQKQYLDEPKQTNGYDKPKVPPKTEVSLKGSVKLEDLRKGNEPAKLVAYPKPKENGKPDVSLRPPAYCLETERSVSLEPTVLLEDCSKKRIAALNARLAFEKFVFTGKLPP